MYASFLLPFERVALNYRSRAPKIIGYYGRAGVVVRPVKGKKRDENVPRREPKFHVGHFYEAELEGSQATKM